MKEKIELSQQTKWVLSVFLLIFASHPHVCLSVSAVTDSQKVPVPKRSEHLQWDILKLGQFSDGNVTSPP